MVDFETAAKAATEEDLAYAIALSNHLIDVLKSMSAIKQRLYGQAPSEGFDIALLARLVRFGPMRASDLADLISADPSTVSRQVAGLVKSGLIQRQSDPNDGRASILVPTDAGRRRMAELSERRGRLFSPLIQHWDDADRATMLNRLSELADDMRTHADEIRILATDLSREDRAEPAEPTRGHGLGPPPAA